jgi:hypothetical protein
MMKAGNELPSQRKEPTMKSHLIPEPQPIENDFHDTDSAHFMAMDRITSPDGRTGKTASPKTDDFHRGPEVPMRNFLRVVFVH